MTYAAFTLHNPFAIAMSASLLVVYVEHSPSMLIWWWTGLISTKFWRRSSLVPRPTPFFCSSVCIQYNTRILNANRRTKNGVGLGMRLKEKHGLFYQISVRRACLGFSISFNVVKASCSVPVLGKNEIINGWACRKPAGPTEETTSITKFPCYTSQLLFC